MDPSGIPDHLYSHNLIDIMMLNKIQRASQEDQSRFILDVIRRNDKVEVLLDILREKSQGVLADSIEAFLNETSQE